MAFKDCAKICAVIILLIAVAISFHVQVNTNLDFYSVPIYTSVQPKYVVDDRLMNIEGQVALVTGANAGLGFSTTKILASRGATVIMACRNPKKADKAKQKILQIYPNAQLHVMIVDLGDMHSVKKFSKEIISQFEALDMVVLNAGLGFPDTTSKDGFNFVFQVNHLSQAYLLYAFESLLQQRPGKNPSRVALVSSNLHKHVENVALDDCLSWEKVRSNVTCFSKGEPSNYGISKLAQVLFATALSKQGSSPPYFINSLHPGAVSTEIFDVLWPIFQEKLGTFMGSIVATILHTALTKIGPRVGATWKSDVAALTQVHLVAGKDIVEEKITGEYYVPLAYRTTKGDGGASPYIFDQAWIDRNMEITQRFVEIMEI